MTDIPYEPVPDGPIDIGAAGQFPMADHVNLRSFVFLESPPGLGPLGGVIFTFQMGNPDGPPLNVADVLYVGTPEVLRKLGTLLRDTLNGAANAVERQAR
jgi:hypothetical protein